MYSVPMPSPLAEVEPTWTLKETSRRRECRVHQPGRQRAGVSGARPPRFASGANSRTMSLTQSRLPTSCALLGRPDPHRIDDQQRDARHVTSAARATRRTSLHGRRCRAGPIKLARATQRSSDTGRRTACLNTPAKIDGGQRCTANRNSEQPNGDLDGMSCQSRTRLRRTSDH